MLMVRVDVRVTNKVPARVKFARVKFDLLLILYSLNIFLFVVIVIWLAWWLQTGVICDCCFNLYIHDYLAHKSGKLSSRMFQTNKPAKINRWWFRLMIYLQQRITNKHQKSFLMIGFHNTILIVFCAIDKNKLFIRCIYTINKQWPYWKRKSWQANQTFKNI